MLNQKLRKMDEMEREISLKSMRWSYLFIIIVLVAWVIWDACTGSGWQLPTYILLCQNLLYFTATQLYRRQVGDKGWKEAVLTAGLCALAVILAGLIVPLFLIGRGI